VPATRLAAVGKAAPPGSSRQKAGNQQQQQQQQQLEASLVVAAAGLAAALGVLLVQPSYDAPSMQGALREGLSILLP
jgi:hypothetical protein